MADQIKHRMSPGSHEERYGPQCVCGAGWDWWNDKCMRQIETQGADQ